VCCRDTGVVVGESTLLLDFKRLTKNVDSLDFKCSHKVVLQVAEEGLCILRK
jgi:hypothetical protein